MHEEALFRDLRQKLEEVALRANVRRIRRIVLRIGALSHVTERTLRSRWDSVMAGTPAEGAWLTIETLTDPNDPRATSIELVSVDVGSDGP